jgi:hypothetical protein
VNGKVFQPRVNRQSEAQAKDANDNAEEQKFVAVDAEKGDLGEIGKLQIGFAAGFVSESRCGPQQCEREGSRSKLGESTA